MDRKSDPNYRREHPLAWRLEQALWSYWARDMEYCYANLTRVCELVVTEDYEDEQTET